MKSVSGRQDTMPVRAISAADKRMKAYFLGYHRRQIPEYRFTATVDGMSGLSIPEKRAGNIRHVKQDGGYPVGLEKRFLRRNQIFPDFFLARATRFLHSDREDILASIPRLQTSREMHAGLAGRFRELV